MRHGRVAPIKSETALGKGNLWRIFGFLAPYWPRLVLILGTVAAAAFIGLVPPLLVRGIIDSAIEGADRPLLLWLSAGLFAAAVALGLVGVLRSYLNTVVSQRIMYDLKLRMFRRLQSLSLRFYTEARTGELMSRLTSDIAGIDTIISGTLVTISQNVLILTTTLVTMIALDWRLTSRLADGAALADHPDVDGGEAAPAPAHRAAAAERVGQFADGREPRHQRAHADKDVHPRARSAGAGSSARTGT